MSFPLAPYESPLLSQEEYQNLAKKLLIFGPKNREKEWQQEAKTLAIAFAYYEPAFYLSRTLGEPAWHKEIFWFLIFVFMWQEKGHSTLDLTYWCTWVTLHLEAQENLYMFETHSTDSTQDYRRISQWVRGKIADLTNLKALFKANPRLVSNDYSLFHTPLIWDKKKATLSFTKLLKKEELFIATLLKVLQRKQVKTLDLLHKEKVLKCLKEQILPFHLSEEQLSFIDKALTQPFLMLSGGPGTGKTSAVINLLRLFIALWNSPFPPRIALCAPTGLASRRLKESLSHSLTSPFLWQKKAIDTLIAQQEPLILQGLLGTLPFQKANFNCENPLPYDLVIVDESSMIGTELMHNLLQALSPKSHLILIGDPHQLAPVEWGSPFADLVNLAKDANCPLARHHVCLSLNFRFNKQISLQILAEKVLNGSSAELLSILKKLRPDEPISFSAPKQPYQVNEELYGQFISGCCDEKNIENELLKFDPRNVYDCLLTTSQNKGSLVEILKHSLLITSHNMGIWGVNRINHYLLEVHQKYMKKYLPFANSMPLWGVPIMVTRNRSDLEVFNGQRGLIFYQNREITLAYAYFWQGSNWHSFPLTHLGADYELSFCATVHKSQGGEYDHITLILAEKKAVLSQELLYTALTRAKNSIKIYSTPEILTYACKTSSSRLSYLSTNRLSFVQKLQSLYN